MFSRYRPFVILVLAVPMMVRANTDGILACADIAADSERLACYDRLAAELKSAPVAPAQITESTSSGVPAAQIASPVAAEPAPAPTPAAASSEPAAVDSTDTAHSREELEEKYGKEHWESEVETPETITASVDAVSKSGYGKLVVTLDNGQVWKQVKNEKVRIAVNDKIQIERGMLRSHFFRVNDGKRKIRFTRVQ